MASSPRTGRSSAAIPALIIGAVLVIGVAAVALLSGGDLLGVPGRVVDSLYPPVAVTEQGAAIRELYTIVFWIAVVIFFVVEGLIIWTVLRYRRRPGDDTLPPQTHGNNVAELVWTVVPTIIVAFLFVVSWQTLNSVEAVSANPETRIRAVAGQFQWTFDYFDASGENVVYSEFLPTRQDSGDGGMVVPAGRSVLLSLESPDVLHAFYVPQFLFKRDVVPGRVNSFEFKVNAEAAGQTFRGQCAELCGAGHRMMLFDVVAKTPAEFDAWLADKIATAGASPPPAPSGDPGASAPPAGPVVKVSAFNILFEQTALTAPAGVPFQIEFENKDASIPHNVEIKDAGGASVFSGEIFNGVETRTYDVPALAAGAYTFLCTVHPAMTGTLTAN
jgi:cytochrome c oxidase subunit 2